MTSEERIERLETAVTRIAESQANAWDAIGAMAKDHAILTKAQIELKQSMVELKELVERFIRAQHNGKNGS